MRVVWLVVLMVMCGAEAWGLSTCPMDMKDLPEDDERCYVTKFGDMFFYECWVKAGADKPGWTKVRDGIYCAYNENGMLRTEEHSKYGETHGVRREYYDNGLLFLEDHFVDGKREGEATAFYESGELQFKGYYERFWLKSGTCYTKDGVAVPMTKRQLTFNNCRLVFEDNNMEWVD